MKTDKKNIGADVKNKELTIVVKTDGKLKTPILITVLPVLAMVTSILPDIIRSNTSAATARLGILTLVLTSIITFYIRLTEDRILEKKLSKTIVALGYLGSIALMLLVPGPEIFCFWMIGGLVTAMLIDGKLGLLFHFNLSFIMGISMSVRAEIIIQILIIGVLMSLLAGALKQKSSVIYAAIIILSSHITLSFALNNFIFESESNYNYLNSLFSILAVLVTAFFICMIYHSAFGQEESESSKDSITAVHQADDFVKAAEIKDTKTEQSEFAVTVSELTTEALKTFEAEAVLTDQKTDATLTLENTGSQPNIGIRTSYDILCDLDNELIKKMREFSESLYSHSVLIGDLSCRAAKEIGADEELAMAGGLYHEIGKLRGKNYIEEGLILAEEYAFPKELRAILKEHNIKYEKPSSVEAAIVMLSDNVVSTIEYIEKTEEHRFTTDKIIDNIFIMRMDKGTFDLTSLSLNDFKKLKEFYQREFRK
jgi:cyclic-di-AMP phosphodiesterase PgpH